MLGERVTTLVSDRQERGNHHAEWEASRFASGVYYYVITAGEFRDIKKMVLLK
jgi:hypothetical protein